MLTVYIDFKSPGAYLAIAPTLELAERFGVAIDWRPFRTIERDVPKLGNEETVGESHRRVRAAALRAQSVKYAKRQGIDLNFPPQLGSTDLALGALASLDGDPLPFINSAFSAYWDGHANLDDLEVVRELVAENGGAAIAEPQALRDLLETALSDADEAGIVGAPAYVIDDQIFVGREHLPWIEEILREKQAATA
ncbi:MAG: DsbA family protein [Pseudomonadota bacterium]